MPLGTVPEDGPSGADTQGHSLRLEHFLRGSAWAGEPRHVSARPPDAFLGAPGCGTGGVRLAPPQRNDVRTHTRDLHFPRVCSLRAPACMRGAGSGPCPRWNKGRAGVTGGSSNLGPPDALANCHDTPAKKNRV